MKSFNVFSRIRCLTVLLGLSASFTQAETIRDLSTVFYGKVLSTRSAQAELLTKGTLKWMIRRDDGKDLILAGNLSPLNDGEFSYRLNVPHEALGSGLTTTGKSVPLTTEDRQQIHYEITIDEQKASIVDPASASFDVSQAKRGAVYRLDLQVDLAAEDSDGDGLPDWWEKKYGLDLQSADGSGDLDGDGLTNLQEYIAGSDPTNDGRKPSILTTEIVAYHEGSSGVLIQVSDLDSRPEDINLTFLSVPEKGRLLLRNAVAQAEDPDLVLEAGQSVSLADVQQGRLIVDLHDSDSGGIPLSFDLAVSDGDPTHAATQASIAIAIYEPDEASLANAKPLDEFSGIDDEQDLRLQSYLSSLEGAAIVWDLGGAIESASLAMPSSGIPLPAYLSEYMENFGSERRQVLIGSSSNDHLWGGAENDVIFGGEGDDTLAGSYGADHFLFLEGSRGQDVIEDFGLEEGDVIDIRQLLQGSSSRIEDYVSLTDGEKGILIAIDADADGSGFDDLTIVLEGLSSQTSSLLELVEGGHLLTGDRYLAPRVSLAATHSKSSENDPKPLELVFTRTGDLRNTLQIALSVTGQAVNGLDYSDLPTSVTFAAGQGTHVMTVTPYVDTLSESDELIEVSILPGEGYELTGQDRVAMMIEDLKILVSMEVLEPLAEVETLTPGVILVRRSALLDRSILVKLTLSGSATNGLDYQRLDRFINFSVGQTTALLEVMPLASATIQGIGWVDVSIDSDASYRIQGDPQARVSLVSQGSNFAGWRARAFPESSADLETFSLSDPGAFGVPVLMRYALGLDPKNPDLTLLPRINLQDGRLTLHVKRPFIPDATLVAEVSTDMKSWDSSGIVVVETPVEEEAAIETVYQSAKNVGQQSELFIRLRAVLKP